MAVLLWILRSTFTFLLGLVLFATFLVWLVAGVALKLFDAWPYVDALREQDAYQRFFDQVMAEDSPNSPMRDLLHEVPGVTYKEKNSSAAGDSSTIILADTNRGQSGSGRRLLERRSPNAGALSGFDRAAVPGS